MDLSYSKVRDLRTPHNSTLQRHCPFKKTDSESLLPFTSNTFSLKTYQPTHFTTIQKWVSSILFPYVYLTRTPSVLAANSLLPSTGVRSPSINFRRSFRQTDSSLVAQCSGVVTGKNLIKLFDHARAEHVSFLHPSLALLRNESVKTARTVPINSDPLL